MEFHQRPNFFRRLNCFYLCYLAAMLLVFASGVTAREIANTPLVAYSGGGRNILLILGNTATMDQDLDDRSKAFRAKQAIKNLITDSSTVTAKTVDIGQMIGLGLMTYGGTRTSPIYVYGKQNSPYWNPAVSEASQSYYYQEFTNTINVSLNFPDPELTPFLQACGDENGSYADLFYREAYPNSHPYCLPRFHNNLGYSRPNGYKTGGMGACLTSWTGFSKDLAYSLCYGGSPVSPKLGFLRIPIQSLPKYNTSAAEHLKDDFSHEIADAFDHAIDINPIEGALISACDYLNTKFRNYIGSTSKCFRGYPPNDVNASPVNVFSSNSGSSQGVTEEQPNTPIACNVSTILLTDNLQNATADGIPYTPDWSALEYNPGRPEPSGDNNPYYKENNYKVTDPVLVALTNLNGMNRGISVPTYVVGLGVENTDLNRLAQAGYNEGSALAYYPNSQQSLKNALDNAVSTILYTPPVNPGSSASSSATNSTSLQTNTLLFQAKFTFAAGLGWAGDLVASTIDTTNYTAGIEKWKASEKLLPFDENLVRHIYSYRPDSGGISFEYANLSANQQHALTDDSDLVDWIKGGFGNAGIKFKIRLSTLLGDIVNSDPVYVGAENYGYETLPEGSATLTSGELNSNSYQNFLNAKATRQTMVYVGANDGMLHGFNANASPDDGGGSEVFAYVPNALIGEPLVKIADPAPGGTYFRHVFGVDGSSTVGDAYLNDAWKTVLVGTTGAGGKSVFALDVTSPLSFSASKVLWEISDTTSGAVTPAGTADGDATAIHDNLGYTLAQPLIVRLNGLDAAGNHRWAAIVANGYNSRNGHAVLFILNLANGSLIKKIDTGVAGNSVLDKNGLSAPVAVDIDGNRTADYIYAGDLAGNLWKFDISSDNASNWGSSYNTTSGSPHPKPLFVACTNAQTVCDNDNRQPITAKPNVGVADATGQGVGVMVYVGTGKYFELGDNVVPALPQTQTFYALWDNNSTIASRSALVGQSITAQPDRTITSTAANGTTSTTTVTLRTTSDNVVNYAGTGENPAKRGWFMDMLTPSSVTPNGSLGERIIAFALVRSGRVIFETMTPSAPAACTPGGTSWVMELDALYGTRLSATWAPFDLNGDGLFNDSDLINDISPSGMKLPSGMSKTPALITLDDGSTLKVFSGSGDNGLGGDTTTTLHGSGGGGRDRRASWSQLH